MKTKLEILKTAIIAALTLANFLAGAAELSSDKPLRITMIQEWAQFNPITYNLASVEALLPMLVRGFAARGPQGQVLPDLVEAVPSLKNRLASKTESPGQHQVVSQWRISAKAKWGDGKPVTCADFKLAWQIGSNANVSTQSRVNFTKIQNVEWSESAPQVCKLISTNQDWSFDRDLPFPVPSHLEASIFEKFKGQAEGYDRNSTYVKDPTNPGLYNGPYLVKEFKIGSHFILEPNPYFMGESPKIKKIIVSHLSDTSALKAQLLSKQTDMVSAVGFPLDTAIALSEDEKQNHHFVVRFQSSSIFQGLFLNNERGPLKEVKVRKALALAIDKEMLATAFFKNRIDSANTFLPQVHPAYLKRQSEFSREKAKALLDEAGWTQTKDGLRSKEGQVLKLEFKTSAGIKIYENIQLQICEQFKVVGVGCKIKNEPPRVLLGDSVPKGQFDIAMFGQPIQPDTSLTATFSSKEIPSDKNSWAGGNVMRWHSKNLDEMLNAFDQEWDSRKRTKLMRKIESLYFEDRPFIPVYHRKEAMVIPKGLKGVSDDFTGTGFSFPERWSW